MRIGEGICAELSLSTRKWLFPTGHTSYARFILDSTSVYFGRNSRPDGNLRDGVDGVAIQILLTKKFTKK